METFSAHIISVEDGHGASGGGTLPKIDLGERGLMGNSGVGIDEDDGMGGRLGAGHEDGGIITPFPFQPAPVGGTAVGGHEHHPHIMMHHLSNIGVAPVGVSAAGYPNVGTTILCSAYSKPIHFFWIFLSFFILPQPAF
jgi:hypothetical protein